VSQIKLTNWLILENHFGKGSKTYNVRPEPNLLGVGRTNVNRHTNFIKISQMVAEISHLTFFNMAAVRHLGFKKNDFWTFLTARKANMRRNRSNRCWNIAIYPFLRWRPSAILYWWGKFWNDPQREFDCLTVQNLVLIALVVLMLKKVWIFCTFGLKTRFHAPFWVYWGKNRRNGQFLNSYRSWNAITRNWRQIKQTT